MVPATQLCGMSPTHMFVILLHIRGDPTVLTVVSPHSILYDRTRRSAWCRSVGSFVVDGTTQGKGSMVMPKGHFCFSNLIDAPMPFVRWNIHDRRSFEHCPSLDRSCQRKQRKVSGEGRGIKLFMAYGSKIEQNPSKASGADWSLRRLRLLWSKQT